MGAKQSRCACYPWPGRKSSSLEPVNGPIAKLAKGFEWSTEEESFIHEAAYVLLQKSKDGGGGKAQMLDRSSSVKSPLAGKKKLKGLPRSSSTKARSFTDPVVMPHELVNQKREIDAFETKKVVLVHGGGFGAWCWYKTITLLSDTGFEVFAINLTGSGNHSFDTNNITSLPQYINPLTKFMENLSDTEKIILVGHDLGGACISYAMEAFPLKIAKSIFLAATMPKNGQSFLGTLSQEEATNNLMQEAQIFLYANGKDKGPTAIDLEKSSLESLIFNQSSIKDLSLALVSMRPIPFAPLVEKLVLSDANYGSVRRFYIETTDDNTIPFPLQQSICASNPPEKVFRLKGSDHAPFFSRPQALHKILVEIASISSD